MHTRNKTALRINPKQAARARRARAKAEGGGAGQRQQAAEAALHDVILENIDLEAARLRTFDLEWVVDPLTGRGSSWPGDRFSFPSLFALGVGGVRAPSLFQVDIFVPHTKHVNLRIVG